MKSFPELTFHHFGLALKRERSALNFLRSLGYSAGKLIYDPEQNVNLRLCKHKLMPAVEIVLPGEDGESPLTPILKQHSEIIYHTCYETENLSKTLSFFEENNVRCMCVSKPKPAILFGGRYVSFYQIIGFGLIELLEK